MSALLWLVLSVNAGNLPYAVVGTGQSRCYNAYAEIAPPRPGQPFFGQDAQYRHNQPAYTLSADGLTVRDNVTGLTWQSSPNLRDGGAPTSGDKLTARQAALLPAWLNQKHWGSFGDWRLPTIKELYSLILFSGIDASRPDMTDPSGAWPFIDTRYFKFVYGDPRAGERTIDSQWATGSFSPANPNQMFGVNFADGRIKGYGTTMPGRGEKTFFVLCVRGNPAYGHNDFVDNGDGTITDRATGLMWAKADSGLGFNWESALTWVQARNEEHYLGHDDWRLPDAKELQSIVDYSRCPDTSGSPAISPRFDCTPIANEIGRRDYGFYWTSTTHVGDPNGPNGPGGAAVYVAFGRGSGWPSAPFGPLAGQPTFADVHGAGCQRSDPKAGDPRAYPHGRGPQGDVVRINNFVRPVRGGPTAPSTAAG
jgi:hypothetical protein